MSRAIKVGDKIRRKGGPHPDYGNGKYPFLRGETVIVSDIFSSGDGQTYIRYDDSSCSCYYWEAELVEDTKGYYCLVSETVHVKVVHPTLDKAKTEAERLTRQYKKPVQVLEIIGEVKIPPPVEPPVVWS